MASSAMYVTRNCWTVFRVGMASRASGPISPKAFTMLCITFTSALDRTSGWAPIGGGEKEQLAKRLETYDGISIDYEAARKNFYGLRPHLRSGADLPALRTTEVEIACLRLAATIHEEVTSIRARRVGNRIAYRVVDEVLTPEGYTLEIMPRSSRQPITLGQLISLIDNAKICDPGGGKAKESVESLLRSKPPKLF